MRNHRPVTMEITVLSAEGLRAASSLAVFSHRLRPFITLTMVAPPSPYYPTNDDKSCHVYTTRVDDEGGTNPTWGDKFRLPIDSSFFTNRYSGVHLQLYTKRILLGQAQLGWCQIPAHDIGLPSAGTVRHLSYRLRARDGSRTRGVINIAVRLEGLEPVGGPVLANSVPPSLATCQTVIGIPVRSYPAVNRFSSTCHEQVGIKYIGG
ncbi:BON1-associated protein 2-like [Humulus lupulus]|uniref:BON1-associated protein 2-like n=1 Tax=Humulus lupulus TaxID=3486 RepID=UPI002B40901E|nr:BON1-associated protein 2-like [Humulus lupulus]